jgi:Ca-activated chloride channel family protein
VSGKKFKVILILSLAAVIAQRSFAESTAGVVREANKLYRQGQFKEAIDDYDRALTQNPAAIEPRFNKADGYYRLDDLQQAIDLYKAVAAESRDMKIVEKAKYNLGDCFFRQGTKQKDSDLKKAMEDMQTAIGFWRQVLDFNPANENAAKNIEVARLTIKDIIDQINKQKQEQQKQQQQQKQTQEDLKKLLEQQKNLANKTEQEKQQPNPDYNDIAKEQSQLKDKTEQVRQELQQQNDPNKPNQQMQQAAQQLDEAADKQKDASQKLEKADANDAKKSQDDAAKNIENALKAMQENEKQQQQQQQQQQEQQGQQQAAGQEPNQPAEPNQAEQQQQQQQQVAAPDTTAQEILDREKSQKEQRQMMKSPGFQKVDKDW